MRVILYPERLEVVGKGTFPIPPNPQGMARIPPIRELVTTLRKAGVRRGELLLADTLITPHDSLQMKNLPPEGAEVALSHEVHRIWGEQAGLALDNIAARHLPTRTGVHIEAVRKSDLKSLQNSRASLERIGFLNLHLAYWAKQLTPPPALIFFVREHYLLTISIDSMGEIQAILPRSGPFANPADEVIQEISRQTGRKDRTPPNIALLDSPELILPGFQAQHLTTLDRPLAPPATLLALEKKPAPPLLRAALWTGLGLVMGGGYTLGLQTLTLAPLQAKQQTLSQEEETLRTQVGQLTALQRRRDMLKRLEQALTQGGTDFPGLFDRLANALPEGVGVVESALGGGKNSLTLEARSPQGLVTLTERLKATGLSATVEALTQIDGGYQAKLTLQGWDNPPVGGTTR